MALSATAYNYGKKEFFTGNIDFDSDTLKCALMTSAYTPDIDATSLLIGFINFGANKTLTDGTFTITLSAAGVIRLT